jgi:hypothetical protein
MHRGDFEPKVVLLELGVGQERARRKWSNYNWGTLGSTGLVRVCERQAKRGRERCGERRELEGEREQAY